MPKAKKPVARKATPKPKEATQAERFIEAARRVGASEDPKDFDRAFARVLRPKGGGKSR
jgi:hypothetical protein